MSLFVNKIQGLNAAYSAGNVNYNYNTQTKPRFVQQAVSSPYSLTHPRTNDMEGIKASPVANVLDILA